MFQYPAHARAYLKRAQSLLEAFDTSNDVSSLFYAALELRFGIEARLYDYIDVTYKSLGLDANRINDYVASKLLKHLISVNPDADKQVQLHIISEQTGYCTSMHFTPVTPRLAKMHGQLGEILHFKFFRNNQYWYLKMKPNNESQKTLQNYRDLLGEVAVELETATSGNLLSHPMFTAMVQDVMKDDGVEENQGI